MAVAFPTEFGRLGREGMVVEFRTAAGVRWFGNFKPGIGGISEAVDHPDGRRVLVFSGGDAWVVDPDCQDAECVAFAVDGCWRGANDLILSRQGLAFLRLTPSGIAWHTRRLSWDGFDDVRIVENVLYALAWSPLEDRWMPCSVNLVSGRSEGGSFGEGDPEGWETLAADAPG